MNIHLEMFDLETSEKLATGNGNYVLNFNDSHDAGFKFLLKWLFSCVRGIRIRKLNAIELRIQFTAPVESQQDFLDGFDKESLNIKAGAFLV